MAIPRKELVDSHTPGFYHCTNRCVRRAFLCGTDKETGKDYGHRKDWIEERIGFLSTCFAVDVYAYAVMSNHYHIVLYLDPQAPLLWSDEEVANRWLSIYPSKTPQRSESRKQAILHSPERLKAYRERLGNLSWFMSRLNEPLAKLSNQEDACSGKFWEKRYHSQALLDEGAVLSCMSYVDLNPVRANITQKLEESHHTSIKRRIQHQQTDTCSFEQKLSATDGQLQSQLLNIRLHEYLALVEWTGQTIIHPNKASIPTHLTPILERLNLQSNHWLKHITDFNQHYVYAVGTVARLRTKAKQLKKRCLHGMSAAKRFYVME